MSLFPRAQVRSGRSIARNAIALLLLTVSTATAQMASHAYVPLEHWSMPYLEHLVRRGVIPDPSPMLRPWRAGDVANVIASAHLERATSAERAFIDRIGPLYPVRRDTISLWVEADAGLRSSTHDRINSDLRELGEGQLFEQIGANAGLQFGNVGLVMHPLWDPNFNHDPDYGGRDVPVKIRYPEAYATVRSRYLSADFGRLRRHWGPIGLPSLIVSSNPYPFDQLFFQAGLDRVSLQMTVAQLDDMLDADGEVSQRFWVAHRLSARITDFLDLAAWEGSIISHPGQTLEFWFMNPVAVQFQGEDEQITDSNALIGGDGELRLPGGVRLGGSLTVDDIQLLDSGSKSEEPPSYAITGIVDWAYQSVALSLAYTQVSNLSYRSHDPSEAFLTDQNLERGHGGVGLARNYTDYDQATLKAGFLMVPGLLLEPEVTLLRQGEGDLRQPFPAPEDLGETATIFSGTVETTLRLAVSGSYTHPSGGNASFSAGWHHTSDLGHMEGVSEDRFVGTLHLRYIFNRSWNLRAAGIR